ncbi:hypothetical protein L6R52_08985 [Myxococcota bacterium]|nr:hypothetical protein [Myxococcota bacterium]
MRRPLFAPCALAALLAVLAPRAALAADTSTAAAELPAIDAPVGAATLVGVGLTVDHHDADGYPESATGLLVTAVDAEAGPIVILKGDRPHYVEAQFSNVQRDAVLFARRGVRTDQRPDGSAFEIAHGFGALKRTESVVTLVEARIVPHFSDNQKSYELFPLTDLYAGAALAVTGPKVDVRYVHTERWVAYAQAGLNLLAVAGARVNATFGATTLAWNVGAGWRYTPPFTFLGTNWTTGVDVSIGAGDADEDPSTNAFILMPGIAHELEWAADREFAKDDHRTDARPSDWGQQSFFGKVGVYLDPFSGTGGSGGVLVDFAIGWRFNFIGPTIPPHPFKETKVTFASDRYVKRKLEETERQRQLEERLRPR